MKILFICLENTCRSQMAEGFAKEFGLDAESAGLKAGAGVNKNAVTVMKELDIDISGQKSKCLDDLSVDKFELIISLCGADASAICPGGGFSKSDNWNIDDPHGKDIVEFRRVRDLIKEKVSALKNKLMEHKV